MEKKDERQMNKLKAVKPGDFPLRSSLFDKRPNGTPGSTWGYLRRGGEGDIGRIQSKQIEYGSNAMTFIVYHAGDPECVCNPMLGCPNAEQAVAGQFAEDTAELNRWKWLLAPGLDLNVYLVPCFFCGDDSATTKNFRFHELFLKHAVPWLDKYSKAYLISTEASKSMDVVEMYNLISYIKQYTTKPVGVHNQGTNIPANADFLAYEFSWHPKYGNDKSVAQVVTEAQHALNMYPNPVWFQEMNLFPEGQRAREQSRAIREMAKSEPRIVGLPGPL